MHRDTHIEATDVRLSTKSCFLDLPF